MEDRTVLPRGYRFYPTEEELISFYLHNKLQGKINDHLNRVIPEVHIYDLDPWQLPQVSGEVCNGDSEQWFFFTPRQDREARGGRPNRTTNSGYWKATGSPGYVYGNGNRVIGVKKTMVFYKGKAPTGRKTKWKMNEYKAIDHKGVMQSNNNNVASSSITTSTGSSSTTVPLLRHEFSLCRIYVKSGCLRAFDRRPSEATNSSTTAETTIPHENSGVGGGTSTTSTGVGGGTGTTSTSSAMLVDHKAGSPNCDISFLGDDVPPHCQSVELGGDATTAMGNWEVKVDDFQHPLWGWEQLNWDL